MTLEPMYRYLLRGLVLGAVLTAPVRALEPGSPLEDYDLRLWGSREGLPQMAIRALGQSGDGYLWVGTRSGLVRFDGSRFKLMEIGGAVEALAADPQGRMWAGFTDGRLVAWKRGRREEIRPGNPDESVLSLLWGREGGLWIGTSAGLARWQDGRMEEIP
ncbi:MAG TPA: hypothetical protein DD490_02515, partial [Acidobacteria bacterium]|nr:hypothetical protein [Acidobacteriota bacterium]